MNSLFSLRDTLSDWADFVVAPDELAICLGIASLDDPFAGRKLLYWTSNPLGELLSIFLDELEKVGAVQYRVKPLTQYRWNPDFSPDGQAKPPPDAPRPINPFREIIRDWQNIHAARASLASCLGLIMPNEQMHPPPWLAQEENPSTRILLPMLEELVTCTVLEVRDAPVRQFRWNPRFDLEKLLLLPPFQMDGNKAKNETINSTAKRLPAEPAPVKAKPSTPTPHLLPKQNMDGIAPLRERLHDWTDLDGAQLELAKCLGMVASGEEVNDRKWFYLSSHPLAESLSRFLDTLAEQGILEFRKEPFFQYRWNPDFDMDKVDWPPGIFQT